MEKLSCDSRVKWRTACELATLPAAAAASCGAGSPGCRRRRRSACRARRPLAEGAAARTRVFEDDLFGMLVHCHVVFCSGGAHGGLESFGERVARRSRCRRACASRWRRPAARCRAPGSRVERSKPPTMPRRASVCEHRRHRAIELQHRLVEARPLERELHALDARQRRDQLVACARCESLATRARPSGPSKRQVDRRRRDQQALVGADVRRRLAAADVLLARLQREREALACRRGRPCGRRCGPASGARIPSAW